MNPFYVICHNGPIKDPVVTPDKKLAVYNSYRQAKAVFEKCFSKDTHTIMSVEVKQTNEVIA